MKYFIACCVFCLSVCGFADVQEGASFVVLNAKTGKVLLQQSSHKRLYPASTTKMALVAYALNTSTLDLNQKIAIPLEAVKAVSAVEKAKDNFGKYPSYILEKGGTIAGFKAGEIVLLKDVLWGIMLPSGNDAANTLAYYWGNGSIEACVDKMNEFVASIGCRDTHFMNPHGFHHPEHYSSAYDLALIGAFAMKNETFRNIVKTASYTKEKTNKQPATVWQNTNKLVVPGQFFYEQATGIKTGYHSKSQHCLIASGETSERSVIVSLLHCDDRKQMFLLGKKLLQKFLTEPKKEKILVKSGPVQLRRGIEGHSLPLLLKAQDSFSFSFFPSEEPTVRVVAEWNELVFPIKEGQRVGTLKVFADEKEIGAVPLLSAEDRKATWLQRFLETKKHLQSHRTGVMFAVGFILVCAFFVVRRRR